MASCYNSLYIPTHAYPSFPTWAFIIPTFQCTYMCVVAKWLVNSSRPHPSRLQQGRMNSQLRAGLMCVLYKKALLAAPPGSSEICGTEEGPSTHQSRRNPSGRANDDGSKKSPSTALRSTEAKKNEAVEKPGEVATLMSLDAGRVVNLLGSFHELWSLPLQMAVALYLLYLQVVLNDPQLKSLWEYSFLSGALHRDNVNR